MLRVLALPPGLNSQGEAVDQRLLVEWFAQEANRSRIERTRTVPFLRIRGHENNGCRVTGNLQALLQVETTQARHLQIRDQAGRGFDAAGIDELLRRREGERPVSQRQHKVSDALSGPGVIIDD